MKRPKKPAKRRPPVVWGYANGQHVVTRAAGRHAVDMPAYRLHGMRDTIRAMSRVVSAFQAAHGLPERPRQLMIEMSATVACRLMQEAMGDFAAIMALSPSLRAAVEQIEANLQKAPGDGGVT